MTIGRLARNSARQPTVTSSAAPSIGPRAAPRLETIATAPSHAGGAADPSGLRRRVFAATRSRPEMRWPFQAPERCAGANSSENVAAHAATSALRPVTTSPCQEHPPRAEPVSQIAGKGMSHRGRQGEDREQPGRGAGAGAELALQIRKRDGEHRRVQRAEHGRHRDGTDGRAG